MSASPFGFGTPQMRPEDLARLFQAMPMGAPQGFAPIAESEADVQRLEQSMGMVPASTPPRSVARPPLSFGAPAGSMTVPLPPQRPSEFQASQADLPAEGAQAIMSAAQTAPPAAEGPSFLDRIMGGIRSTDGLLTSLGVGLMSTPGFGAGAAAGLKAHQEGEGRRAASRLAQAEYGLKAGKLARETGAQNQTKALLIRSGHTPEMADGIMAAAIAGDRTALNNALNNIVPKQPDAPSGYRLDPTTGRASYIPGGPQDPETLTAQAQARGEDKTVTLLPDTERAQLGLPAGSYQRDANGKISPINPTGTTINMGAEKAQDATVGKGQGEYQLELATKGRNASSTLNTLALMEQAMKTPGFYSGFGGETAKRANQILGALGVKDPSAASAAEVFDALSNKVVLDGLGGSLGPGISNTDRDYIARTAPTLAQSEQGNRDLIGVARALAQRQQQVSKLARDYAAKNNGRLDSGFDQALDEFAAANPLFPQARESVSASAPQEPPQGAPTGARRAGDGNWYAPDPNRPGKYLKVQ